MLDDSIRIAIGLEGITSAVTHVSIQKFHGKMYFASVWTKKTSVFPKKKKKEILS